MTSWCARSRAVTSRSMPAPLIAASPRCRRLPRWQSSARCECSGRVLKKLAGSTPNRSYVTAETAWRMITRRDPYVKMLRTTMATFAAGVGGADSHHGAPLHAGVGLPDPFARPVARDTQLILLEESNLAKVSDPSAGSGPSKTPTRNCRRRVETVSGHRESRRRVRRARSKA